MKTLSSTLFFCVFIYNLSFTQTNQLLSINVAPYAFSEGYASRPAQDINCPFVLAFEVINEDFYEHPVNIVLELTAPNETIIISDTIVKEAILPANFATDFVYEISLEQINIGDYRGELQIIAEDPNLIANSPNNSFMFQINDNVGFENVLSPVENLILPYTTSPDPIMQLDPFYLGFLFKTNNYFSFTSEGQQLRFHLGLNNLSDFSDGLFTFWLYEWVDENNDQIVQLQERSRVGFNNITIPSSPIDTTALCVNFIDFNTANPNIPIEIKDQEKYIIALEYFPFIPNIVDKMDLWASYLPPALLDNELITCENKTIFSFYGDDELSLFPNYFSSIAPYSKIDFGFTCPEIDVLNNTLSPLLEKNIVIKPNPVNDLVTISLDHDLVAISKKADLVDLNGRKMVEISPTNTIHIDATNLNDGIYFLQLLTEKGLITKKIIVQH